jgi:hypothetical protein
VGRDGAIGLRHRVKAGVGAARRAPSFYYYIVSRYTTIARFPRCIVACDRLVGSGNPRWGLGPKRLWPGRTAMARNRAVRLKRTGAGRLSTSPPPCCRSACYAGPKPRAGTPSTAARPVRPASPRGCRSQGPRWCGSFPRLRRRSRRPNE